MRRRPQTLEVDGQRSVGDARKILVFDTETTGMVDWKHPENSQRQPHLVQLGMLLVDTLDWQPISQYASLVDLEQGVDMEPGALAAHGISAAMCREDGVSLRLACDVFVKAALQADRLVAHNLGFDRIVMRAACERAGASLDWLTGVPGYCTMEASTPILQLPGKRGHKWPTLAEAYAFFSGQSLQGAHDASVDAAACLEIYRGLQEREVIP